MYGVRKPLLTLLPSVIVDTRSRNDGQTHKFAETRQTNSKNKRFKKIDNNEQGDRINLTELGMRCLVSVWQCKHNE